MCIGISIIVLMIIVIRFSNIGIEVCFIILNGLILFIFVVVIIILEIGEMVWLRLEVCSIGIIRNVGLSFIFVVSDGVNFINV